MISLDTIEKEITELEARDTSYATIERLAWLYIVRDNLIPKPKTARASGSEFLQACNGADINGVLGVFDELMDVLKAVYPKEYTAVLNKILSLQDV